MTVELLQTLSMSAFIAAAVFFLLAVAMFFLFNIPKVVGEVTGSTARKAIEEIREQNEKTGNKAYRPSAVNAERGKVTEKITPSGKLEHKGKSTRLGMGTAKLSKKDSAPVAEMPANIPGGNETTVLDAAGSETTVLAAAGNETTVLGTVANETTVLTAAGNETTVLVGAGAPVQPQNTSYVPSALQYATPENSTVKTEYEISFLGSAEIIE